MNITVVGLGLDAFGFLIVFMFGGFDIGAARLALESHRENRGLKFLGSGMIITGFVLQMFGAWGL